MSLATEYAQMIREARSLQLMQDASAVRELERLLAHTAKRLRQDVRETPRGILGERYRRELLASMEKTLDAFRAEYKNLLDDNIIRMARIAEEREKDLVKAVLYSRDGVVGGSGASAVQPGLFDGMRFPGSGNSIEISFGQVPNRVLETLYARVHEDGLRLSGRLYNLDLFSRTTVADIVTDGIATGQSARKMGLALGAALESSGVDNLRYRTFRIARTEINTAFREGHRASITEIGGKPKTWVRGMGWRLSPSHPRIDICDAWAGDDPEGLGAGNYSPNNLPVGHPCCLCFTVTLLVALPGENFVSHRARPDLVPKSQRLYYAGLSAGMPTNRFSKR